MALCFIYFLSLSLSLFDRSQPFDRGHVDLERRVLDRDLLRGPGALRQVQQRIRVLGHGWIIREHHHSCANVSNPFEINSFNLWNELVCVFMPPILIGSFHMVTMYRLESRRGQSFCMCADNQLIV